MHTFTLTASTPAAHRAIRDVFAAAYDADDTPAKFCKCCTVRGAGYRVHVPAHIHPVDVRYLADTLHRRAMMRAGTTGIVLTLDD